MIRRRVVKLHGRIAVSEPARQFASRVVPGPYDMIPNGIDLERFSRDVAPMPQYMDGKLNLLFLGRLEFRKGLNYLLNAYRLVKPEFPDSRLLVVGPGTRLRKRYEGWIENTGLKDVVFVGEVSHEEVPRYFQTADIYCAPATSRESFGIVLLEAMALGKPVAATNIPGYASVATDEEDALLVPPRDYHHLAEVLRRLMGDAALRNKIGARGRATAESYSWDIVADQVLDCYQRAIDRTGGKTVPESSA